MPKLFAGKSANAVIRVWCVGCSTGEEAYSLAILLAEHQAAIRQSFQVQVFATDIDSRAIATARGGIYPAPIAADVSPERLTRFFTAEDGQQALDLFKDQDFDVILMDVQMPVMNGVEATKAIRSSTALGPKEDVPIIALTAYAMTGGTGRSTLRPGWTIIWRSRCEWWIWKECWRRTSIAPRPTARPPIKKTLIVSSTPQRQFEILRVIPGAISPRPWESSSATTRPARPRLSIPSSPSAILVIPA